MSNQRRDNSGTLSPNSRKERENHPDYKGQATINGTEYWISAWIRDGQYGEFFSMAFEPKDKSGGERGSGPAQPRTIPRPQTGGMAGKPKPARPQTDDMDDDIPF